MYQSLDGAGFVGGEYPVMVQVAYIDQRGDPQTWTYGFYYTGKTLYDNAEDIRPNNWYTFRSYEFFS